ncbi:MAG: MurR/RpiR family transcriptional regulator [Oscillospiraceae bacterium]|nr:MurR/RpiR family transcriptional regulator [Oscillospiraceae bacterium]
MTQVSKSVFQAIDDAYYELTAAERKAADYVLKNRERTQFLSISELAEESGVAEATISRFCRRLGYKGYNAFKLAIANAAALSAGGAVGISPAGKQGGVLDLAARLCAADSEALQQTLTLLRPEAVERAVEILRKARRVLCMGQGGSMILASEAAHLFSVCDGKYFAVSDSHQQVISCATLGPEDAVLFFSYSGSTRDMIETLGVARAQGARIVLISRFPRSPGAALADVLLQCGSNETPLQPGSVPARIAQLFLLDVLYNCLCLEDPETSAANRQRIAVALADKHL